MFWKKTENHMEPTVAFDPKEQIPILKCSICNGEQVAGFKDKKTGHFTEVAFIRNEEELRDFMKTYGIEKVLKEY